MNRSGTDEQYTAKEELLTEAAQLYQDAVRRKRDATERQAKTRKTTDDGHREVAVKIRDSAMKTFAQKRSRGENGKVVEKSATLIKLFTGIKT